MAVQGELVQAGVVLPYQDLEIERRWFPIKGQCPDSRRLQVIRKIAKEPSGRRRADRHNGSDDR